MFNLEVEKGCTLLAMNVTFPGVVVGAERQTAMRGRWALIVFASSTRRARTQSGLPTTRCEQGRVDRIDKVAHKSVMYSLVPGSMRCCVVACDSSPTEMMVLSSWNGWHAFRSHFAFVIIS